MPARCDEIEFEEVDPDPLRTARGFKNALLIEAIWFVLGTVVYVWGFAR